MKTISVLSFAFFFAFEHCSAGTKYSTITQVASDTRITNDPYTKTVSAAGPPIPYGKYRLGYYTLVARKTANEKRAELLVQEWRPSGDGWLFLESAHDIHGKSLPVRVVAREVENGGSIHELVAIDFPKGYLKRQLDAGLNIRIDGSRDSLTMIVPGFYLQGVFAAIAATPQMR